MVGVGVVGAVDCECCAAVVEGRTVTHTRVLTLDQSIPLNLAW